jgi:hypothetical protein
MYVCNSECMATTLQPPPSNAPAAKPGTVLTEEEACFAKLAIHHYRLSRASALAARSIANCLRLMEECGAIEGLTVKLGMEPGAAQAPRRAGNVVEFSAAGWDHRKRMASHRIGSRRE